MSGVDHGWAIPFLHYGYVPRSAEPIQHTGNWQTILQQKACVPQANTEPEFYIDAGKAVLRKVFDSLASSVPDSARHVVPLSGGLDSRAILAGLLERLDRSQINTVTFGVPGTWDYEIGRSVAKAAGVPNFVINLDQIEWNERQLLDYAKTSARPHNLFEGLLYSRIYHVPVQNPVYWSGFMGDVFTGGHLSATPSASWSQARQLFGRNQRSSRFVVLTPPQFDPTSCLPDTPFLQPGLLGYDEQLDFGIRQELYIAPLVLQAGHIHKTPFIADLWLDFILRTPFSLRQEQRVYRQILQRAWPALFSLPTKTTWGTALSAPAWQKRMYRTWWLAGSAGRRLFPKKGWWGINPAANYIDFGRALRNRRDLAGLVHQTLRDLESRKMITWLDIMQLWEQHQQHKRDHASSLLLLASLEIWLKATNG